jgi:hypothetical protein
MVSGSGQPGVGSAQSRHSMISMMTWIFVAPCHGMHADVATGY